jgi:hypothetical protein
MTDQELYDHFRLEGARLLLAPFRFTGIPEDAAERDARLEPVIRTLWDAEARGGRTLYEVAAEVYAAADVLEAGPEVPPRDITGPPGALREIAAHVAAWNVGSSGKVAGAVPTSGELAFRFPQLIDMLITYYGQDGLAFEDDGLSPREGLQLFVDDWHPRCLWRLPHVAAECQQALAVFQTEEALERFFRHEQGCGTPDLPWLEWLPLIVDVLGAHMRAHHPPRWTHPSR